MRAAGTSRYQARNRRDKKGEAPHPRSVEHLPMLRRVVVASALLSMTGDLVQLSRLPAHSITRHVALDLVPYPGFGIHPGRIRRPPPFFECGGSSLLWANGCRQDNAACLDGDSACCSFLSCRCGGRERNPADGCPRVGHGTFYALDLSWAVRSDCVVQLLLQPGAAGRGPAKRYRAVAQHAAHRQPGRDSLLFGALGTALGMARCSGPWRYASQGVRHYARTAAAKHEHGSEAFRGRKFSVTVRKLRPALAYRFAVIAVRRAGNQSGTGRFVERLDGVR